METDRQDAGLYYIQLDGGFDPLREHGFFTDVLVSWAVEGDAHAGLVRATPEQVTEFAGAASKPLTYEEFERVQRLYTEDFGLPPASQDELIELRTS